jgi:hypothetical protein
VVKESTEIAQLIEQLGGADEPHRLAAAANLFTLGANMAWPLAVAWMADTELAALFVTERYDDPPVIQPETTVGVAVSPGNFMRIRGAHGDPAEAGVPPDQDAREFELHPAPSVRLDILTSRNPAGTGALARFLQRNGEGIQQVEFQVRDAARVQELLHGKFQLTPIYPYVRPGANGTIVNFFLLPVVNGEKVLVEFFEVPQPL